jgi:hypothetical protein
MSLDSDPIDQAFPDAETSTPFTGDPIDAAFKDQPKASKSEDRPAIGDSVENLLHGAGSSLYHGIAGGYKGLYSLATGQGSDAAAKAVQDEQAKAYVPPERPQSASVTPQARAAIQQGTTLQPPTGLGDWASSHGASPGTSTALALAPTALAGFMAPRSMGTTPAATAEDVVSATAAQQSGGAAGAARNLSNAPPELRQAIVNASQKTGGAVNPDALDAHLDAAEHGVQLMKGQATRDPEQYTAEQNSTHPDIVARINKQNGQMVDAIDTIRRDASPTNVANSPRENGQVVLDDLKAYDKPKVAAINQAYNDANAENVAAGRGALKLDPQPGIDHANAALEDREELLPGEGRNILDKMKAAADAGEGIPLKQAETWKTIISRSTRKYQQSGDTNAVNALSDFRDSLEQMSPNNAAAPVQAKFNNARAMAKARFDEQDADPAYAAAVNDSAKAGHPSALADTFLDDYALNRGAPKSQLDLMMSKLSPEGQGAVASHTLSAIRKSAVNANGNVLPNGYNTALAKYGDKLPSLVQPDTQESLGSLGRTITNAKVEPPGGKVNYSRSGVVARDAIQSAAEHVINAKTSGVYGIVKKMLPQDNAFAREALKPGAGLDQLKSP